jgi:hypothetical protein
VQSYGEQKKQAILKFDDFHCDISACNGESARFIAQNLPALQ